MSIPPNAREAWRQLNQMAQTAQKRGGGGTGKAIGGIGGLLLLGGGLWAANHSLFNVDGGHRAIKYTRIGGVGKEIYNEGAWP
jgi:prohibitin 2